MGDAPVTAAQYATALAERLALLTGCVNLRPFWDAGAAYWRDPGTLLMVDFKVKKRGGAFLTLVSLCHDPDGWNTCPALDGKRYPITDARGNPPHPTAVFPPGWEYQITEAIR